MPAFGSICDFNVLNIESESASQLLESLSQARMIRKHSATLHGHRTSFSLEDAFWDQLNAIAAQKNMPLAALLREIDDGRSPDSNLSSALRVFVLDWVRQAR